MIHPILAISHHWSLSWLGVCPLIDEQFRLLPPEAFSWLKPTKQLKAICQTTLVPRSHKLLVHVILSPLESATKRHGLQRELPMASIA
jgi:hypothetical protein